MGFQEVIIWPAAVVAFGMSFALGANDVANALGTSVGSGALSLRQATIIGAVMEFLGVVIMGRFVSATIKGSIVSPDLFEDTPELFALGMFSSLFASAVWLLVATWLALPVSTTHSIVGGIIAFGVAEKGISAIDLGSVGEIFLSWITSPILGALVSIGLCWLIKATIHRAADPEHRGWALLPWFSAGTMSILSAFIIEKEKSAWNSPWWVTIVSGVSLFIITWIGMRLAVPHVKERLLRWGHTTRDGAASESDVIVNPEEDDEGEQQQQQGEEGAKPSVQVAPDFPQTETDSVFVVDSKAAGKVKRASSAEDVFESTHVGRSSSSYGALLPARRTASTGLLDSSYQLEEGLLHNLDVEDDCRTPSERAEHGFIPLMVLTAIFVAFAHGSNDIANAIGPFSAVYDYHKSGKANVESELSVWVYAVAGVAIILGLFTLGYRVIATVGSGITPLSYSKGYAAQFGAAITVLLATFMQIPVSTTHTLIGGVTGTAFTSREEIRGINKKVLARILIAWVATIVAGGAVCLLVYFPLKYTVL